MREIILHRPHEWVQDTASEPLLSPQLLGILTVATVLTAGNVYYCQPLLGEIASSFHQSAAAVGSIPMLTQAGYVGGLILVTPLGDVLDKRKLVVLLLALAGLALLSAGLATSLPWFALSSLAIGITSVLVQILIPFVAVLSSPAERGKNLGVVVSGALIGILLSRTVSGLIGAHLGWRGIFLIGSALMMILAIFLALSLPSHKGSATIRYPQLLRSIWVLWRDLPGLQALSVTGALMYAALSAFWATLAFHLQSDPYRLGPEVAGSFGLVGALSALSANLTGRYVDRLGSRRVVQICTIAMMLAYVSFLLFTGHLAGLVAGVILLDLGAQAATVSNQAELYRFHPEAQTRLNTIYKILYFGGGACGSALGAVGWEYFGWAGVCGIGGVLLMAAWIWERASSPSNSH